LLSILLVEMITVMLNIGNPYIGYSYYVTVM